MFNLLDNNVRTLCTQQIMVVIPNYVPKGHFREFHIFSHDIHTICTYPEFNYVQVMSLAIARGHIKPPRGESHPHVTFVVPPSFPSTVIATYATDETFSLMKRMTEEEITEWLKTYVPPSDDEEFERMMEFKVGCYGQGFIGFVFPSSVFLITILWWFFLPLTDQRKRPVGGMNSDWTYGDNQNSNSRKKLTLEDIKIEDLSVCGLCAYSEIITTSLSMILGLGTWTQLHGNIKNVTSGWIGPTPLPSSLQVKRTEAAAADGMKPLNPVTPTEEELKEVRGEDTVISHSSLV